MRHLLLAASGNRREIPLPSRDDAALISRSACQDAMRVPCPVQLSCRTKQAHRTRGLSDDSSRESGRGGRLHEAIDPTHSSFSSIGYRANKDHRSHASRPLSSHAVVSCVSAWVRARTKDLATGAGDPTAALTNKDCPRCSRAFEASACFPTETSLCSERYTFSS